MPNIVKKIVRVVFDSQAVDSTGVSNAAIGTHGLGVYIPSAAVVVNSAYDVQTTFTSATDAATIAFQVEAANDIKTATAISTGTTYDNVTNMVAGTPVSAATGVKTTAQREVSAVVAVEALTAGKLTWFLEYYLST